MKVLTVIGARPQFVKAAVISREIKKHKKIEEVLVHTGQHFDANMSDVFFSEMDIPKPKHYLDINGMTHGKMTGRMLEGIEELFLLEKPDVVLVYGDTNSTLAGALAASKLHIPVAHIEAGLRSFNMQMPEEVNRIVTDRLSKWLFCPTTTAFNNLLKEGYENFSSEIFITGDVMYDAALFYSSMLDKKESKINLPKEKFILATIHREENTHNTENLKRILSILNNINKTTKVVIPMHPGTLARIKKLGITPEFQVIDPVGYFDMIRLLQHCEFVITDSGGLQKEAYFFDKYCITLREQTEWVELCEHNVNFICGTDWEKVESSIKKIANLSYPKNLKLYGDGNSGKKIVEILKNTLVNSN